MEGFIADSTFNIISATLDEKSFDTKTKASPILQVIYFCQVSQMEQTVG